MKNKTGLGYPQVILFAVVTELTLIAIQFGYLKVYSMNTNAEFAFTAEYMKSRGFYIFQIIGFFLYTIIVYLMTGKMTSGISTKLASFVVAGGIVELGFYIFMTDHYEGAYLYSILDKIIATSFGLILFNYTTEKHKRPESYF
jgi:hypothetical protein